MLTKAEKNVFVVDYYDNSDIHCDTGHEEFADFFIEAGPGGKTMSLCFDCGAALLEMLDFEIP